MLFQIVRRIIPIAVSRPHGVEGHILRLDSILCSRCNQELFQILLFRLRRERGFMLCHAPAHKDLIGVSGEVLLRCQCDLGVLRNACHLCRSIPTAAVEVIGEGIGLQHVGCSVVILVIAPCGVNRLICRFKGNLCDGSRRGVRAAEN